MSNFVLKSYDFATTTSDKLVWRILILQKSPDWAMTRIFCKGNNVGTLIFFLTVFWINHSHDLWTTVFSKHPQKQNKNLDASPSTIFTNHTLNSLGVVCSFKLLI